jgi:hypothetical protein
MRNAVFSDDPIEAEVFDTLAAGWFFVVENEDGSIAVRSCESAQDVSRLYDESDEAFTAWVTADQ